MRPVRPALRPLVLAVTCLLAAASVAEAGPPRRRVPPVVIYPTVPSYYSPSVYAYPQAAPVYPYSYPVGYGYPTGWYGSYTYNPGSFYYTYSPWGTRYYYTNPSFSYRYRIR